MYKGPSRSIVRIPQNFIYLLYLRLELSGHLNKTVKTPMPSYYKRTNMYMFSYVHL